MDAIEIARQRAEQLHYAAISRGLDPGSLMILLLVKLILEVSM